jgi:hypothetical protein
MAQNQRKYNPVGCFFSGKIASCPNGCLFLMSPLSFLKTLYINTKKEMNTRYGSLLCDQR